jgi:hypothetical protein
MAAALVIAATLVAPSAPAAQLPVGTFSFTEPAGTLVMPFDVKGDATSFAIVSRISGGPRVIATHWSYWSASCDHLADVFICLTQRDTVVVDPSNLHGEVQTDAPSENQPLGPGIDLSGERGLLTVTAYVASDDALERRGCAPAGTTTLDNQIVGAWTIAHTSTNAAFSNDAIGLSSAGDLPDPGVITAGGLSIPTLNPQTLTDSEVIVLGVKFPGGNGEFENVELGPLSKVTCDAAFIDNLEVPTSLPDLSFKCAGFNPISQNTADEGEKPLIPPTLTLVSSGLIRLTNCVASSGRLDPGRFIFAFHGQAVGPFGAVVTGKYTGRRGPI